MTDFLHIFRVSNCDWISSFYYWIQFLETTRVSSVSAASQSGKYFTADIDQKQMSFSALKAWHPCLKKKVSIPRRGKGVEEGIFQSTIYCSSNAQPLLAKKHDRCRMTFAEMTVYLQKNIHPFLRFQWRDFVRDAATSATASGWMGKSFLLWIAYYCTVDTFPATKVLSRDKLCYSKHTYFYFYQERRRFIFSFSINIFVNKTICSILGYLQSKKRQLLDIVCSSLYKRRLYTLL